MRESRSRPSRSVPSRCSRLPPSTHAGGVKRARRDWAVGSGSERSGATRAATTNSAIIASENSGSRRPRRSTAIGSTASRSGRARTPGSAGMADARVDQRVQAVDAEGDHRHDDRGGETHRLDQRKVARADPLVGETAEAGPREDGLDHDGGGDQDREVDAGERDHRDQRVLERVQPDHPPLPHPLDPRELDVLGIEHLEHARAQEAHEARDHEPAQREPGQDVAGESLDAARGQPLQAAGTNSTRRIATQNVGSDCPRTDTTWAKRSRPVPLRTAAITPSGNAIASDTPIANTASLSELGSRSRIRSLTGRRARSELPKSPVTARPTKERYCST